MSEHSGRTSPQPFAWFDPDSSSWKTSQPSLPLENLPEPQPTWPRSGTWDLGHACERPPSAHPTAANAASSLLPTPAAGNFNDGEDPEGWLARREQIKARGINGNGMGTPLAMAVQLLPTPQAHGAAGPKTPEQIAAMRDRGHGVSNLNETVQLLPTPTARLGDPSSRGASHPARRKELCPKRAGELDEVAIHLLPTPVVTDAKGTRNFWHGDPTNPPSDAGSPSPDDPHPHLLNPTAAADDD